LRILAKPPVKLFNNILALQIIGALDSEQIDRKLYVQRYQYVTSF